MSYTDWHLTTTGIPWNYSLNVQTKYKKSKETNMTNLEILKKAFEMTGNDCDFEEEDGELRITLHLIGSSNQFIFSAKYTESVDLDYVIPALKMDFDYNETVSNEEGWFVTGMMKSYIQEPENNGCWACEGILNTWKLEVDGLEVDWYNFESNLEEALDKLQSEYYIEVEYIEHSETDEKMVINLN